MSAWPDLPLLQSTRSLPHCFSSRIRHLSCRSTCTIHLLVPPITSGKRVCLVGEAWASSQQRKRTQKEKRRTFPSPPASLPLGARRRVSPSAHLRAARRVASSFAREKSQDHSIAYYPPSLHRARSQKTAPPRNPPLRYPVSRLLPVFVIMNAQDRFNINSQLEHLQVRAFCARLSAWLWSPGRACCARLGAQAKYVGTGHSDISRQYDLSFLSLLITKATIGQTPLVCQLSERWRVCMQ